MIRGSNKTLVFDINQIQNKLAEAQLKTPSTKALQHQQILRQKNYQSDVIAFMPPILAQKHEPPKQNPKPSFPKQELPKAAEQKQAKLSAESHQFRISARSSVYDFRKKIDSGMRQQSLFSRGLRPLTPIKENEQAKVVVPPSRSMVGDPDNGIMFLDNGRRIANPVNAKTPPPPLWGEVLEEENYDPNEEFYDHAKADREMKRRLQMQEKKERRKKLKKKVVYVYESDSDEDEQHNFITRNSSHKLGKDFLVQSNRATSTDARFSFIRASQSSQLPPLSSQKAQSRPPLPKPTQSTQTSASRQIRTGAFQRLPSIGMQMVK